MSYALRRPPQQLGVGPMLIYRSVSRVHQPLDQQPVAWVRSQPAFAALDRNPDPTVAEALAAASVGGVAKVWTELAYESVRMSLGPELPSRLDSLYAFADPLEALAFADLTDDARDVWEGLIGEGTTWAMVDMSRFRVIEPDPPDAQGFEEAWTLASRDATAYWRPAGKIATAEILVAGPIRLTRRLELLPLLRELGMVELSSEEPEDDGATSHP